MDKTITAPPRSLDGTTRFIRYAFMPNKLRYCGGDDNSEMFAYALATIREPPLETILRKFTGAMPYLTLIARSNAIADPFDDRVVEAYWIGNELLDHVEVRDMYASLRERYSTRLSPKLMALVANKAPEGARAPLVPCLRCLADRRTSRWRRTPDARQLPHQLGDGAGRRGRGCDR